MGSDSLRGDTALTLRRLAALELAVTRREQTADDPTQWQIPFDELPDGRLAVPANEANGTVRFFTGG